VGSRYHFIIFSEMRVKSNSKRKNVIFQAVYVASLLSFVILCAFLFWGMIQSQGNLDVFLKIDEFNYFKGNFIFFLSFIIVWIGFALYFFSQLYYISRKISNGFKKLKNNDQISELDDEISNFL